MCSSSINSKLNVNKFLRQCQDMMTKSSRKKTFDHVFITRDNQDKLITFIKTMSERPNRGALSQAVTPVFKEFLCNSLDEAVTEVIKVNPGIDLFINRPFESHFVNYNELLTFLIHTSISLKRCDLATLVRKLHQLFVPTDQQSPVTNYKRIMCVGSYLNTPFNPQLSKKLLPSIVDRMIKRLNELTEQYSSDSIYIDTMIRVTHTIRSNMRMSSHDLKLLVKSYINTPVFDPDDTNDEPTAEELLVGGLYVPI